MLHQTLTDLNAKFAIRTRYDNFIGGKWVAPVRGQYFDNLTPITGAKLCEVARSTAEDIELALDAAHAAAPAWGRTSTAASFWRILFCPAGPGHVLYLKSELTHGGWRIFSDNIAMARWLQQTVQGMLNAELKDLTIPVHDAAFSKSGDPRYFWTEHVETHDGEISLTWYDIGEGLLIHTEPNQQPNPRPYGVCTVLVPALGTRLSVNGQQARGKSWARQREGRPFST